MQETGPISNAALNTFQEWAKNPKRYGRPIGEPLHLRGRMTTVSRVIRLFNSLDEHTVIYYPNSSNRALGPGSRAGRVWYCV